jgi:serine/threonine protein kinase
MLDVGCAKVARQAQGRAFVADRDAVATVRVHADAMNSDQRLPAGTRLGNYEITGFVGEGGMGMVYAAVHLGLGKPVAIKILRASLAADPHVRARFLREGKAAAAVRHPNVVDVDDVGVSNDDTPYLAMELLEGENLGTLLKRLGRLSVAQTVDCVIPVLSAMDQAHKAGVVHRDLKPDNVFLARGYGGAIVPKVLDFGISKLVGPDSQSLGLTGRNDVLGSPYYMSPEQAGSGKSVDARSDLYAIGVILYQCVSGQVPFPGSTLPDVIGKILHAIPEPLSDVPEPFERAVMLALAKHPAQRPASAQALALALLPFASERTRVTHAPLSQPSPLEPATPLQVTMSSRFASPQAGTLHPLAHSVASRNDTPRMPRRVVWASWLLLTAALSGGLVYYFVRSNGTASEQAAEPLARPKPIEPRPQPRAAESSVSSSLAQGRAGVAVPDAGRPKRESSATPTPTLAPSAPSHVSANTPPAPKRKHPRRVTTAPPPSAAEAEVHDPVWGDRL